MSSLKKYDVQIPPRVIDKLKRISNLSGKRRWEYAGRIVVKDKFKFEDPIFVTSKNRSQVKYNTVTKLWPSPICFHTHPCKSHSSGVFCTLPSKHDFEVFIYNFPLIQSNIICDGHGYYVINVLASAEGGVLRHSTSCRIGDEEISNSRGFASHVIPPRGSGVFRISTRHVERNYR